MCRFLLGSKRHNCISRVRGDFQILQLFFRGNFEPGLCALQRIESTVDIDGRIAARQPLLGALFGFASAVDVDF